MECSMMATMRKAPEWGRQESAVAVPNEERRRRAGLEIRRRYLIAEMIAAVAISTTEISVAALISMVTVIFTIGSHPFRGLAGGRCRTVVRSCN